ncbi:hypothetical protein Trydic_g15079 [Trypoxylus dichotomus]
MFSDSGSDFTTYSQDERISAYLAEQKILTEEQTKEEDEERRVLYEQYFEDERDAKGSIFQLDGLTFIRFRHTKIKFTFEPSKVVWTNRDIIFYCSLYYRHSHWYLRRDTFPVDRKYIIYKLLERNGEYAFINDDNIILFLRVLYNILIRWSAKHEEFRRQRYREFQDGVDITLYPDEEMLFLTEGEIEELHRKRDAILRRMLPPQL